MYCLREKNQQLRLKKKTQVLNADTNKLGPNGQLITTLFVLAFNLAAALQYCKTCDCHFEPLNTTLKTDPYN